MIRLLHHSQQHNNNITTITYVSDPGLLQNSWVWLYNDVYLAMSLSVIAVSDPQVIVCKLLVPKLVSEILAHKPCDYEINILRLDLKIKSISIWYFSTYCKRCLLSISENWSLREIVYSFWLLPTNLKSISMCLKLQVISRIQLICQEVWRVPTTSVWWQFKKVFRKNIITAKFEYNFR